MATEQKAEGSSQTNAGDQAIGLAGKIEAKYRELKEHAETYPYVWASYVVVYGGFGLWFTYRFRKLRKTEDRVRALQERLRQLAQADESASSSSAASAPRHVDKPPKLLPCVYDYENNTQLKSMINEKSGAISLVIANTTGASRKLSARRATPLFVLASNQRAMSKDSLFNPQE